MKHRNGNLKPISGVIEQIADELGLEEKRELNEATKRWDELVGPRAAKHTRPLFIDNRTLHVEVDGSAWAQEISFRKNSIIQGVNNRLGRPLVNELRTTVQRGNRKKK